MKKSMVIVAVFAVLLLASALGAYAQTVAAAPDPVLAVVFAASSKGQMSRIRTKAVACGFICYTDIQETTAVISGSGSDCPTAQSNLNSQLQAIARGQCQDFGYSGACQIVDHDATACTFSAGIYQMQGYATYSCRDYTC
ncbi:MAG TPA: hypothetical protein VGP73_15385 [Thermoanaerobaculia bacterium]